MAVSLMKKLSVISHSQDSDKIIRELMWICAAHIEKIDNSETSESDSDSFFQKIDCDSEISTVTKQINTVKDAIDYLSTRGKPKKSMFAPRPEAEISVFDDSARWKSCLETAERLTYISSKLISLKSDEQKEIDILSSYAPWAEYDLPLCGTRTLHSSAFIGVLPSSCDFNEISANIEKDYDAYIEKISEDASGIYISVAVYSDNYEAVTKHLSSQGFSRASFADDTCTAQSGIDTSRENIKMIRLQRVSLESESDEYISMTDELRLYHDILSTQLSELNAKKKLARSSSSVFLSAWIPVDYEKAVTEKLNKFQCAYEFADPAEDEEENVPIYLLNNPVASQYEPVVALYSLPKYKTFDPTAIMSIFYTIIFGLMFADVGYGLVMTGVCLLGVKLMNPKGSMRKFMNMFALCGISSAVMGAIFGGWFGDLPTAIMQNFMGIENPPDISIWFNPLDDPVKFLIVSLAMGAIHLIAGMLVKAYILIKNGLVLDAIFDIGSWLVLFAGLGLYFIPSISTIGMIVALVGAGMLLLTQGRNEKNIIMKFLKGLLSLYNIVSYASDLLSYARILALGMASAVIASVVNLLGTMGGFGIGGVLGLMFAFAVGHSLNLVINVLGTFVHASRLQYIEFFGKFYDDGGRAFEPLMPEAKYVTFKVDK